MSAGAGRDWFEGILGSMMVTPETSPSGVSVSSSKVSAAHRISSPTRHCQPPRTFPQSSHTTPAHNTNTSSAVSSQYHTDDDQSLDLSLQPNKGGCNVAETFCDFNCMGGSPMTTMTPRQQQQRYGRVELEQQQLNQKIRELRLLNSKLHARNHVLEQENCDALKKAYQTTTTSDGTVTALQQRCQEAESNNLRLETEVTALKAASEMHKLTNESLQKKLELLRKEENDHGNDAGTGAGTGAQGLQRVLDEIKREVAMERLEKLRYKGELDHLTKSLLEAQTEAAPSSATDPSGVVGSVSEEGSLKEIERTKAALKESKLKLVNVQLEQRKQQEEHAAAIKQLQSDLEAAKDDYLETEIDLKAKIETLQATATTITTMSRSVLPMENVELLNHRDDIIAALRQQCLDYSRQLTTLQAEAAANKAIAKSEGTSSLVETQQQLDESQKVVLHMQEQQEESRQTVSSLRLQIQEAANKYQDHVAELEGVIQQLELDLQDANEHADRRNQFLTESMQKLETKYGNMERQLLEAKLGLAAADEAKEQFVEEHQASLDSVKKEQERLVEALAAADEEKERIVGELTLGRKSVEVNGGQLAEVHQASLVAVEKEKERLVEELAAAEKEKERLVGELTLGLASAEETRERLVEEYESRISELQRQVHDEEKKMDDSMPEGQVTDDASLRIAALVSEVDRLKKALNNRNENEDQLRGNEQLGGSLEEDLQQELRKARRMEEALRKQLTYAFEEHENSSRKIERKLEDRNISVAALVKTSDSLEEQLLAAKFALESLQARLGDAGVEVVVDQSRGTSTMTAENEDSVQVEFATQKQKIEDLSGKVKKMKKQLAAARHENARLRAQLVVKSKAQELKLDTSIDTDETADDDSIASAGTTQRLLKERDDAISSLVKQAMGQDKLVTELRSEIDLLKSKSVNTKDKSAESSRNAVKQLQQEAEVFAGQVIELDGEIEQLKSTLSVQKRQVAGLEKQLEEARSNPADSSHASKILDLEAEIDELKEANRTQRNELRDLRRKAWEAESACDEIVRARNEALEAKQEAEARIIAADELDKERAALQTNLEAERANKAEIERQLQEQLAKLQKSCDERVSSLEAKLDESRWAFDELKASPSYMSEEGVLALRREVDSLRQDLASQTEEVNSARTTTRELEGMLAERNAEEAAAFEEEKEELLAEIEELTGHLNEARRRIETLEADVGIIDDFKNKLERADEAREESEKNIIDTYERRLSLLTLDKDVTIDKLRNELTIEKESNAEELGEVTNQLKIYQMEISELREEMAEQVEQRETRIFELEHTLAAQEQLVSNMKTEMDHLQGSMEGSVARRKEENDEMQQELLTMTAAAAKQEREIQSLKLELDDKTLVHQSEIAKLEQKISALEKSPLELRNAHDLQMELRVKEVKDRLEKLKWRNTSLKEENLNLRERLEQAEALAKDNADYDKAKALEEQLSKQMTKLKKLKTELKSLKEPPVPETPKPGLTEPIVSAPPKSPPRATAASTSLDEASMSQTGKKVAAPSPSRLRKIFGGRKSAPFKDGTSDDTQPKR